ncbi:MAG TPA: sulfurtransferase [Acidimicrobiia bacterium]
MTEPKPGPLVSTGWLERHVDDPSVNIVEVSADPAEVAAYAGGHVPGSHFAYWKDLLWHDTGRDFADPETIAARLARYGVNNGDTIALVGDPTQFSTYAFFVLAMSGLRANVVHVDGGREKWVAEGRPRSADVPEPRSGHLDSGPGDQSRRIGRDEVRAGLTDPRRLLIDVRSPEEYAGERVSPPHFEFDHGAERTGRIPGARHLYYADLLGEDGAYLRAEELRRRFRDLPVEDSEVVLYCRLSHRATSVWFALEHLLGIENVRVYDGSWTEWGTIVGFPIERNGSGLGEN